MALVAWAGNVTYASNYLKAEKGITISPSTLTDWKVRHGDRYDKLREQYRGQLEENLAHEMRDVARLAVETERLALQKSKQMLEADKERDPARAAANLATVASKNTDKLLALTGRPSQITESRDVGQILRSLVAKGVLSLPEEPKQIDAEATEP